MGNIKKILITGAGGFIGAHLTRRLLKEPFDIAAAVMGDSDLVRINDIKNKLTVFKGDLSNAEIVDGIFSRFKPDVVLHLAAYYCVQHQKSDIPLLTSANILGTLNLLEASKGHAVKLFVNTSSCFVYGNTRKKLKEDSFLKPFNLYALTKLHSEQACDFYSQKYKMPLITFRLFPPYGPWDNPRKLIPKVINSFLNGQELQLTTGKQKWDFIYVGDIVEAYYNAVVKYKRSAKHDIFNIGTGNAVSLRKVIGKIVSLTGTKQIPRWGAVPHRKDELWFNCADITKAKKILKWQPRVNLDEGLDATVSWYVKNNENYPTQFPSKFPTNLSERNYAGGHLKRGISDEK